MSLSTILPHNHTISFKFGYVQIELNKLGPEIIYKRMGVLENHSCFDDFDGYLQNTIVNSSILIGSGNNYIQGLICTPISNCTHYRLMILGINKKKFSPIQSHEDIIVIGIFLPIKSLYYTNLNAVELELELTAITQQYNQKLTKAELCDEILRYLDWKINK